jgi:F420-dependent oxidoreductase-like protein
VELALMIEGQEGVTWEQWQALASRCEEHGYAALFRSDHYVGLMGDETRGSLDAWATINALAAVTSTLRLGTLVSPATFRHPSELAKVATTADHVSGGRIEIGMGAGWNEREHAAYGFAFPDLGDRYDLFAEQVEIVRGLTTEAQFSFAGEHYTLDAVQPQPRPVQSPPPLVLGGSAGPRSAAIAARFADEYNTLGVGPADLAERRDRLRSACEQVGRDPDSLRLSVMAGVLVAETEAEVRDAAGRLLSHLGRDADVDEFLEGRRGTWVMGTPEQAADVIAAYAEAGVDRIMLQHLLHTDLDLVDVVGRELVGQV